MNEVKETFHENMETPGASGARPGRGRNIGSAASTDGALTDFVVLQRLELESRAQLNLDARGCSDEGLVPVVILGPGQIPFIR